MKRIYWLWLAAMLTGIACQSQAQLSWGPRPMVKAPDAFLAAEKAHLDQVNQLNKEAEEAIKKGNLAAAVPLLQQAVQADPILGDRSLLADIYLRWNRPKDVLDTLHPLVYAGRHLSSAGEDITTRMKYVLALLDTKQWPEAATLYEESIAIHTHDFHEPLMWHMLGYGVGNGDVEHTLSVAHFSPEAEDVPGLRAQAHLILATNEPYFGSLASLENKRLPFLLDQAQQSLKYNPRSQEAQFIQARLLMEMKRYPEARAAFTRLAQTAPREAQAEVKATLARMNREEETKLLWERQQQAKTAGAQATPKR